MRSTRSTNIRRTSGRRFVPSRCTSKPSPCLRLDGHPFLKKPTLDHFCSCEHIVVSQIGDPRGFIDVLLEKQKRTRRVVLTVPTFLLALTIVAGSDMLAAVPRNLLDVHGKRLGPALTKVPLAVGELDPAYVVASRAALLDAGVA